MMKRYSLFYVVLLLSSSCALLSLTSSNTPRFTTDPATYTESEKAYLNAAKGVETQWRVKKGEASAQFERAKQFLKQYFGDPQIEDRGDGDFNLSLHDKTSGKYSWRATVGGANVTQSQLSALCVGWDPGSTPPGEQNTALLAYYMQTGKPIPERLINKD